MKIIERIFIGLVKVGKKDVDLANVLGVSTAQVSMWKSRKTDPPAKYMTKIAELLEVSTDYLITGECENNSCNVNMFWERFYDLCEKQAHTKPNNLKEELDISSGVITKWKKGSVPNGETLIKIANYFNVSVDYLLGRTDDPKIHYLNEKQFKLVARGGNNIGTTAKNTPTDKTPRTTKE